MKIVRLFVVLIFAATSFSQVSLKAGPKVNGLALGATREQIIRKLGKPSREVKGKADECVGGTELALHYPGLKFQLWDEPENPKKFTVGMFEVTSSTWDVSGSRIGQTPAAIRKHFGSRSTEEVERKGGKTIWYYEMDEEKGPGNTNFTFRNGKLVNVLSMWLMC